MMIDCTNNPWQAAITGPHPGWPWCRYHVTYHQGIVSMTLVDFARTLDRAERKATSRLRRFEAERAADNNRRVINP